MLRTAINILLLLSLWSTKTDAQYLKTSGAYRDTIINSDTVVKSKTEFRMRKSPAGAMIRSAILPGLGQFYNESYWKIPIIAGLGGYFGYEIVINQNRANDYAEQYQNSITSQNTAGDQNAKRLRDFYRDQRDDFIIYGAILYFINIADAFVDAHLYDFDVSDDLSVRVKPGGKNLGLFSLTLNF